MDYSFLRVFLFYSFEGGNPERSDFFLIDNFVKFCLGPHVCSTRGLL